MIPKLWFRFLLASLMHMGVPLPPGQADCIIIFARPQEKSYKLLFYWKIRRMVKI